MAKKRIRIGDVLDDLYSRRNEITDVEIEKVASMFGLMPDTVVRWLRRNDPDDKE